MTHRKLAQNISVAPIMFGGNVFGWTADEATSHRLLDRFVERGFNAIDTADAYGGGGASESAIGAWLKQRKRRDDVVIATKVGFWDKRPGLSASNIAAAVEDSLRRLQTDYIDVYFAHRWDEDTPQEETLTAFGKLIESGKVRAIGASNYSAAQLEEALAVSRSAKLPAYEVLQPLYNLYDREPFEAELRDVAARNDLGVVPYFALASGFLSGKYRSQDDLKDRQRARLVSRYLNARGFQLIDALTSVAAELGAAPAQVAIAWLIGRPAVTAPIVSATTLAQLDEVLDAAALTLAPDALRRLEAASQPGAGEAG